MRVIRFASIGIIGLSVAITLLVVSKFRGFVDSDTALVTAQATGVLATLFFVYVTLYSVSQNSETLEQLERDREKDVVIDELSEVIQPAIDRVGYNIRILEEKTVGWNPPPQEVPDEPTNWQPQGSLGIKYPINNEVDPTALLRSQGRNQQIHGHIEEYNESILHLEKIVQEIIRVAGPPTVNYIDEFYPNRIDYSMGSAPLDPGIAVVLLLDEGVTKIMRVAMQVGITSWRKIANLYLQ
ncbi:hypothetical protein ACFQMM_13680 [Saliphagus sp. GCM10025308]